MVELLFYLTRCAIYRTEPSDFDEKFGGTNIDWNELFEVATKNNLISIIYSVILNIDKEKDILSDKQREWISVNAKGTLFPELHKYMLISNIVKCAEERNIRLVFFKGLILADLYPQYVERVSSDSDIFVEEKDREAAENVLRDNGYVFDPEESKENVQVYVHRKPYHMVELHTKLWEDYKGPRIDILADMNLTDNCIDIVACKIPVHTLGHENHLVYQLFHIIKHFSLEGIGARYLVDITLFVNRYIDEIDLKSFWDKITRLGYSKFVDTFFSICIDQLGMNPAVMNGRKQLPSKMTDILKADLIKVGNVRDKEARWQIMGAMEAYFTGEEKVSRTKLGKKMAMAFPSAKALPKVYSYARKYPILLPIAWIHRAIKFLFKKATHKDDFFGVSEKMDIGEKRLSLLDELGLTIEDKD